MEASSSLHSPASVLPQVKEPGRGDTFPRPSATRYPVPAAQTLAVRKPLGDLRRFGPIEKSFPQGSGTKLSDFGSKTGPKARSPVFSRFRHFSLKPLIFLKPVRRVKPLLSRIPTEGVTGLMLKPAPVPPLELAGFGTFVRVYPMLRKRTCLCPLQQPDEPLCPIVSVEQINGTKI